MPGALRVVRPLPPIRSKGADLRPPGEVFGIPAPLVRYLVGVGRIIRERVGRRINAGVGEIGDPGLAVLDDGSRDPGEHGEAEDGQTRQRHHGSDGFRVPGVLLAVLFSNTGRRVTWYLSAVRYGSHNVICLLMELCFPRRQGSDGKTAWRARCRPGAAPWQKVVADTRERSDQACGSPSNRLVSQPGEGRGCCPDEERTDHGDTA